MLSKSGFKQVRKDMKAALKEVEEEYGIRFNLGNIRYNTESFTMKVEALKAEGGKSVEQLKFEKHCIAYGLKPDDYKMQFEFNGRKFELVEINPKARKYPFIGREVGTDKRYQFTRPQVIAS